MFSRLGRLPPPFPLPVDLEGLLPLLTLSRAFWSPPDFLGCDTSACLSPLLRSRWATSVNRSLFDSLYLLFSPFFSPSTPHLLPITCPISSALHLLFFSFWHGCSPSDPLPLHPPSLYRSLTSCCVDLFRYHTLLASVPLPD